MSPKVAENVNFEQNAPLNLRDIMPQLKGIMDILVRCPNLKIAFSGHSCSTKALARGSDGCWGTGGNSHGFGYKLSASRAAWVANWFVKQARRIPLPRFANCPGHFRVSKRENNGKSPSTIDPSSECDIISSISGNGGDTPVTNKVGRAEKIDFERSRRVDIKLISDGSGEQPSTNPATPETDPVPKAPKAAPKAKGETSGGGSELECDSLTVRSVNFEYVDVVSFRIRARLVWCVSANSSFYVCRL